MEIWNQIIENFEEKYPNIKVVQVTLPQEESETVLNTRILRNSSKRTSSFHFGIAL